MTEMTVAEILHDFKSIKLPPTKRQFINKARDLFQDMGDLPFAMKKQLWNMVRCYRVQMDELHESRARSRRTNWRIREGLTKERERLLVEERRRTVEAKKADLGI